MDVMQSMQVFRRVAEVSSFSAVAREINVSQSTVSKHVAALEERLGTKLFNRSTRSLKLTDAGAEYYRYCVRILNDFQEAEASVGMGRIRPTGSIRVAATSAFGNKFVIPLLNDFLHTYPDIDVDLVLDDRYVDLVKDGIDLALRVGPLADSSLVARKIGTSKRVVVASPDYLLKHGIPKTPLQLASHSCLLYTLQETPNEWFFSSTKYGDESVQVSGRFKASSHSVLLNAALAHMGITTLCEWQVKEHVKKGHLTVLLKNYQLTPYDVNAIYTERRFVPQKIKCLVELLRENCPV